MTDSHKIRTLEKQLNASRAIGGALATGGCLGLFSFSVRNLVTNPEAQTGDYTKSTTYLLWTIGSWFLLDGALRKSTAGFKTAAAFYIAAAPLLIIGNPEKLSDASAMVTGTSMFLANLLQSKSKTTQINNSVDQEQRSRKPNWLLDHGIQISGWVKTLIGAPSFIVAGLNQGNPWIALLSTATALTWCLQPLTGKWDRQLHKLKGAEPL